MSDEQKKEPQEVWIGSVGPFRILVDERIPPDTLFAASTEYDENGNLVIASAAKIENIGKGE